MNLDIFGKSKQELLNTRLAVTNLYDNYLLANTMYRPWGPGIVLEQVLYFAVHIGCNSIYLAGYDLDDPFKKNVTAYKKYYEAQYQEIDDTNEANKKMMEETEKQNKKAEEAGLLNKFKNILGK